MKFFDNLIYEVAGRK